MESKEHTLSILVENTPGVLSQVSRLFSRKGYNIDSIASGTTEDPKVTRITIVMNGDDATIEQLAAQLRKLLCVISVKVLSTEDAVQRELVLVKAPSLAPYWYDEWDEQICAYAETYGLDYFNYEKLAPEIGIDYNTDTYDAGLHLNLSGAEKLSRYFGAYLTENYDLTDYREDPEYAEVYAEKIRFYDEMREAQYKELEEYGEIISF